MRTLLPVVFASVAVAGCDGGPSRVAVYPVTGVLVANGNPLANATVVFHPVSDLGPDVPKPRGTTAADGRFTLTTYDGNDGAPAGEYRVTVQQWATVRPDGGPENRLPARFAAPESSGLTATVTAGPNELKPISLKK